MLTFAPIYQTRLWGGRRHASLLNRTLPEGMDDCGESWEISDRPEAMSIVDDGPLKGATLHALWTERRTELFGPGYEQFDRFPVLAKILAPEQVLSVQIHPDAEAAHLLHSEEKNECWYFAGTDGASCELFAGFPEGTDAETCRRALLDGTLTSLLKRLKAQASESIFIPAGTVHALGPCCLVYEIQQNADTTYRLDDWGRLDKHGHPRELHRSEALACLRESPRKTALRPAGEGEIAACPHFAIREVHAALGETIIPEDPAHFAVVTVVEGLLRCAEREYRPGDFGILTAHGAPVTVTSPEAKILLSTVPPNQTV